MMPQPASPARGHGNGMEQGCKDTKITNGQLNLF